MTENLRDWCRAAAVTAGIVGLMCVLGCLEGCKSMTQQDVQNVGQQVAMAVKAAQDLNANAYGLVQIELGKGFWVTGLDLGTIRGLVLVTANPAAECTTTSTTTTTAMEPVTP